MRNKCSCGKPSRSLTQYYCKSCHARWMRENRPKYKDLTPEQKLKADCRSRCRDLIRLGKLKRKPCEVCGKRKTESHHEDYTKPLQVNWLCRKHHLERHYEIGRAIFERLKDEYHAKQ